MSDLVSPDDLRAVYKHAQESETGRATLSELLEAPFSFSKDKARGVLMKLVQNRLAYVPREFTSSTTEFGVHVRSQELAMKLKVVTSPETYAVFQTVELSGNQGIGSRDVLRSLNDRLKKSGRPPMQAAAVTRCLKSLETERLIKTIKSVRDNGRKLFILFELEGDRSIMGGAFYKDGNFNVDMIEEYRTKIINYLSAQSYQTTKQALYQFVYSTGSESTIRLSEPDLDKVIRSLILDNMIIQMLHPYTGETSYATSKWPSFEDLERLPCVSCELQEVCQIEEVDRFDSLVLRRKDIKTKNMKENLGIQELARPEKYVVELSSKVTPSTCPYYNQWLKLPFLPWVEPPSNNDIKETGQQN